MTNRLGFLDMIGYMVSKVQVDLQKTINKRWVELLKFKFEINLEIENLEEEFLIKYVEYLKENIANLHPRIMSDEVLATYQAFCESILESLRIENSNKLSDDALNDCKIYIEKKLTGLRDRSIIFIKKQSKYDLSKKECLVLRSDHEMEMENYNSLPSIATGSELSDELETRLEILGSEIGRIDELITLVENVILEINNCFGLFMEQLNDLSLMEQEPNATEEEISAFEKYLKVTGRKLTGQYFNKEVINFRDKKICASKISELFKKLSDDKTLPKTERVKCLCYSSYYQKSLSEYSNELFPKDPLPYKSGAFLKRIIPKLISLINVG